MELIFNRQIINLGLEFIREHGANVSSQVARFPGVPLPPADETLKQRASLC